MLAILPRRSFVFIIGSSVIGTLGEFNLTTCPGWWELQSNQVKSNFSLDLFAGVYYELALHDYTQFPTCPHPTCVRSVKSIDAPRRMVNDSWEMSCFGERFPEPLRFNLTNNSGVFDGSWSNVLPGVRIPDTVVDFLPPSSSEPSQYAFVLEFQCIQGKSSIDFTGINWYSAVASPGDAFIDAVLQRARDIGLGVYMDFGFGTYRVPQTNCSYDA